MYKEKLTPLVVEMSRNVSAFYQVQVNDTMLFLLLKQLEAALAF